MIRFRKIVTGELPVRNTCYQCGSGIDGWAGLDGPPADGDASVCAGCGAILVFISDKNMFVEPGDELRGRLEVNPAVVRMRRMILDQIQSAPIGGWGETVRRSLNHEAVKK